MTTTALGDRMKAYEAAETERRLMPLLPALARLDGRAFHSWTRGLSKPYDVDMGGTLQKTTQWLVEETGALVGYTQSDEITLAWYVDDPKSQIFFDGRIMKMTSQLAALCTARFGQLVRTSPGLGSRADKLSTFDCRVWNVPTLAEAANVFVWRELDAVRNSIAASAQAHYSANQLFGKNSAQMQEMLFAKGINWNDYPDAFKRGSYFARRRLMIPFTAEEIERLPERHEARRNPDLRVERSVVQRLPLPPITRITNRVEVLFFGAEPETGDDSIQEPEIANAQPA